MKLGEIIWHFFAFSLKIFNKSLFYIDRLTFRGIIKTVQNQTTYRILSEYTDAQLLSVCDTSPDALEILIGRYSRLVRSCARPLFLAGADHEDLVQEGMIGLLHAVRSYDPDSGTPFEAFAALCIRHKLISAVRAASAEKHLPLNDSVPIQTYSLDAHGSLETDPETSFIGREGFRERMDALRGRLSASEKTVLQLYLEGLSYREIAQRAQCSTKAVDNAVQRIRRKAASILGENGCSV